MTSPRPRIFDDISKLFNDAAGAARGLGHEAEALVKSQVERLLTNMDVVNRDEFEAVRDMAVAARNANDALERRIADLEAKLKAFSSEGTPGPREENAKN
jgi:BMFP domain-containing protein YqiC